MNIDSRGDIYKKMMEVYNYEYTAQQVANMIDMLPENDQQLAFELIKKACSCMGSRFTKLQSEAKELEEAEQNLENGEVVSHDDID